MANVSIIRLPQPSIGSRRNVPYLGVPLAIACLASVALAGTTPVWAQSSPQWAKARVLIQPRAGLTDFELDKILKVHGGRSKQKIPGLNVHIVELPANANETAVAQLLSHNPHIKSAELDMLVAPSQVTNDTYFANAWHLPKIQAPTAWDSTTGVGVTIAILDSGVDGAHPDLAARMVPGWNFYDNNSNTADIFGHGTKVAGAAAAIGNNGSGVAGVAWNAKIMPVRVADAAGYAYWSTMATALTWAADNGARVANISFSVQGSTTVQSAAQYMKNKGGVVINSAGNTGAIDSSLANDTMISVAATDSADARAGWSSYGPYVDLAAPGVGIWTTTMGGGYGAVNGTSFSSPITAGVVALMKAANPALSPANVESILKSTALDLGSAGYDQYFGYGRINASAAVAQALAFVASDGQAPSVIITAPGAGTVKGIVPVNVSASDNVGVTKVELYAKGALVAVDNTTPFAFSWDTTIAADGTAGLSAKAFDAAGNLATSSMVNVTVANTVDITPPAVSISNPINGAKIGNSISITANAIDNVGIATLSIYIDGVLKSQSNGSTLAYTWNTRKATVGTHRISAIATDASGNSSESVVQVYK
jgi:thermitase